MTKSTMRKKIRSLKRQITFIKTTSYVIAMVIEYIFVNRIGEMCNEITNDGNFFAMLCMGAMLSIIISYTIYELFISQYVHNREKSINRYIETINMINMEQQQKNEEINRHIKFEQLMKEIEKV